MYFTKKELQNINEERLQSLVENSVSESKTLDYKEFYKLNNDEEKKEFLSDVSAFANSIGGNLIYGIKEEDGAATEINGVDISDPDAEILKMENLLRDGIEPRILGYEIVSVKLGSGEYVIILFIPNSFNSPHVVNFKKRWRFYSRNSAGKYSLDVQEVKSAFISSESIADKIRNFRADRISQILNNDTQIPMNDNPKFILHIIPLVSFTQTPQLDFNEDFQRWVRNDDLMRQYMTTYNYDGYLLYNNSDSNYVQFFRSGIIEIVNSDFSGSFNNEKHILWKRYEFESFRYLEFLISVLDYYEISSPYIIMSSILGIKGYKIITSNIMWKRNEITQNNLIIPELLLTDKNDLTLEYLKPIFDPVWNACGYPQSQNYDKDGKWKHH